MNYKQLRKKVVDLSGRFDLVEDTTDYADAGIKFFINGGQRYLDRLLNADSALISRSKTLKKNSNFIEVLGFRAIKAVHYEDDDGITYLSKASISEVKSLRKQESACDWPTHYCIGPIDRESQEDIKSTIIQFAPYTKKDVELQVRGFIYSKEFTDDNDETWWSLTHPETLIAAIMLKIEQFYRNTEGARDWQDVVMQDVQGIDYDIVEEQISDNDQMDSSW